MNNKKLFKGALVLFASILMAVSCSAGDKTGGGDDTIQTPAPDKTLKVELDPTSANTNDPTKTTAKVEEGSNNQMNAAAKKVTITLKGDDVEKISKTAESGKIKVELTALTGLDTTGNETANVSGSGDTALNEKQFTVAMTESFEVNASQKTVSFDLKDNFASTADLANDKGGVVEVTLTLTAEGKDTKTIKSYFVYLGKA